MRSLLLAALLTVGCGRPEVPVPEARSLETLDAGAALDLDAGLSADAGAPTDAGSPPDAGPALRWERDVLPLLSTRCERCHVANNQPGPSFGDTWEVLLRPSTKCPGETIGRCVALALAVQGVEGRWCRTWQTPFHREGWMCLSATEIDLVTRWVDSGMPR
ncbi:MAG: hypothetical protein SFW67_23150 [Myxococcaceae bacterium]|nr:hypothetical protein [Myxococcaceae bacterium]